MTPNAGKDVEQQEFSFIAHENTKWYSRFGRQCVVFYKTKYSYRMSQQLCSLVFTQRIYKLISKQKFVHIFL